MYDDETVPTLGERLTRDYGVDRDKLSTMGSSDVVGLRFAGWIEEEDLRDLNNVSSWRVDRHHPSGVPVYEVAHAFDRDAYGRDLISEANYNVLRETYGVERGISYVNTNSVMIAWDDQVDDVLWDVLEGLGEYPLISDDEYFELQQRAITEDWDSFGESDLRQAVEDALDDPEDTLGGDWEDRLQEWHNAATDELNLYEFDNDGDNPEFFPDLVAAWIVENRSK